MKIAILTTDNREHLKDYGNPMPHFGTAPEALLQGFALLPEVEVHVISCVREGMDSPEKLAEIGPDIVHGQGAERDCAMSAVFSGFPNVLTIHGNMAELFRLFGVSSFYHRLAAWLETLALGRTEGSFVTPLIPKVWLPQGQGRHGVWPMRFVATF